MLSVDENKRLTSIMPGTPMGELFRRYWHPIAASVEMDDRPTKSLRILGEDLVLYKDRSGTLGLIDKLCAHRRVDLSYGIPEENGLRCMYHGWMYDETGQCIEQPFEETVHPDGRFKEKVKINAYKVEELGGLIFAYMGPQPAPLLPRWEPFQWENGWSDIGTIELPCNWLQCMENSLDPVHLEWLHGYWGVWQQKQAAVAVGKSEAETFPTIPQPHKKIGFDVFDYGVIKRRVVGDETELDPHWRLGHPIFFPNILWVGASLQFRVPVDDYNTLHMMLDWRPLEQGESTNEIVPFREVPFRKPNGEINLVYDFSGPSYDFDSPNAFIAAAIAQDQAAWVIEGPIMDRTTERLGVSDVGIIMFRRLLEEQMQLVESSEGDPMNTYRDPVTNVMIQAPCERFDYIGYEGIKGGPFADIEVKNDVEVSLSGEGVKLSEWQ